MHCTTKTASRPIKVVIVYRVLQVWRVPVFKRLDAHPDIELHVLHGADYEHSKLRNFSEPTSFAATKLPTLRFSIRTRNGVARVPVQLGLWRALRRINPDVVITEGASHLFGNLISYIYCKLSGKPLIQWGLGRLSGRQRSIPRKIIDAIFFHYIERNSNAAIAYSSRGLEYYREVGIPSKAVFLAVNTVDTEQCISDMREYCAQMDLPYPSPVPANFKVLFIGALTEGKRVDILLEAFSMLLQQVPHASLQIIGDGDDRNPIEALAQSLALGESVNFIGHKSTDLAKYFYDASVMVLPGLGGLAVSDALCRGVPVICSVGDGSEVDLVDDGNGQILTDIDSQKLCSALHALALDPDRQARLRKGALAKIENEHNVRSYVHSILDAIHFSRSENSL